MRYMASSSRRRGINVNAVNGGMIESRLLAPTSTASTGMPPLETVLPKIPKRRMGTVQEVADARRVPARTGARSTSPGRRLSSTAGLSVVAPPFYADADPPLRLPDARGRARSQRCLTARRSPTSSGRRRSARLRLPHRIVMGSMHLGLEGRRGGRAARGVLPERALGGAGLIVTGGAAVRGSERRRARATRCSTRPSAARGAGPVAGATSTARRGDRPAALPRRALRACRRLRLATPSRPRRCRAACRGRAAGARRRGGLGDGRGVRVRGAPRAKRARLRRGRGDGLGGLPGRPVPLAR